MTRRTSAGALRHTAGHRAAMFRANQRRPPVFVAYRLTASPQAVARLRLLAQSARAGSFFPKPLNMHINELLQSIIKHALPAGSTLEFWDSTDHGSTLCILVKVPEKPGTRVAVRVSGFTAERLAP